MKTLIVPMMGKSTRFPNLRPKWMLTHPIGGFMGTEALRGLNLNAFSTVYFVTNKEHEEKYQFIESFIHHLHLINNRINVQFLLLEQQTRSQPETVYQCIKQKNITGEILVKDSDNFFEATIGDEKNFVCYFDLNDGNQFNAKNKSYIQFDNNDFISNIVEKKIVSSTFSVGGYGFEEAEEFCRHFEKLGYLDSEVYMSNVIFEMLLAGHKFVGVRTTKYEDWGTLEEWNRYKQTFKTLFVDLDGVLLENTSIYTAPFIGTGRGLFANIKLLKSLYATGRTRIIITTARPSSERRLTEYELREHGIPFDVLLMDLPHSQRIIINDYADSNPFPSCQAINIKRNSDTLKDYL